MNTNHAHFFESLSEKEQTILKVYSISRYKDHDYLLKIINARVAVTAKEVRQCIKVALDHDFFESISIDWQNKDLPTISALIYLLPKMNDYSKEWDLFKDPDSWYRPNRYFIIRDFLYQLLYQTKEMDKNLIYNNFDQIPDELDELLTYPVYYNKLIEHGSYFLEHLISKQFSSFQEELIPIKDVFTFSTVLANLLIKGNKSKDLPSAILSIHSEEDFFHWVSKSTEFKCTTLPILGVVCLQQGKYEEAIILFEDLIKKIRVRNKKRLFPNSPIISIFYVVALMFGDPKTATPILKRLEKGVSQPRSIVELAILSIIANFLNSENREDSAKNLSYFIKEASDCGLLICVLAAYLSQIKLTPPELSNTKELILYLFESDYKVLALETAFAYLSWCKDKEVQNIFDQLQKDLEHGSILEAVPLRSEWEKSINALLALEMDKTSVNKETRIVYYINMKHYNIQPVLQTAQAKGGWTKGRNINLKNFYEGVTPGMSELDKRIADCMTRSYGYRPDSYGFKKSAFVELIGSPNVFLDGSDNVPVELVEARPRITVEKTKKGYEVSSDIQDQIEPIIIAKETNTRYKVYSIRGKQFEILNILKNRIVVPEQGKEKLTQLLTGFSKHMEVHSDLLADKNEVLNVKNIEPDSRIRIQLLPLGSGLKAEIFSKPFGEHPPYCKPGKGGKILIANENNTQLQVKRNLEQEQEYANCIMNDIQSLESLNITDGLMTFNDPLDALYLLDILPKHKEICVVEWPEGVRYKIRGTASFDNLSLSLKSNANWFELQGELKINEDTVLTLQQLLKLSSASHNRFIELSDGEFIALSKELKKQLDDLHSFTVEAKKGIQINKFASASMSDFFDQVSNLKVDKSWKEFRKRVDSTKEEEYSVPKNLKAELRPYQEEGFRWLARLAAWEAGACLADDMGLGKTIQALAILLHRSHVGPALVICPVSVVANWQKEAERFAPSLQIKTLSNTNRRQVFNSLEAGDVLISSYGLLQSEEKMFIEPNYATVILDEAHSIKNYATKTSKSTMQLKASFRLALTGTPVQNHLGEIWNLFNFINPGLLGTSNHFYDTFIKPTGNEARKQLKRLISPFILRRTKTAVLDELPPKTEIIKKISLSEAEMSFYEALRRQAVQNIEADKSQHLQVLAEITKLRQASCNPLLVDPNINIPSSKLEAFLTILDDLLENKHQVLVFSQFVTHLALVRQALDKKKIRYQYLDGSMSQAKREENVKRFQKGESDVFLISLKAGGLGLNLTSADFVIHMDPWWNPAIEDQASDRAHRIGQSRPVTIYRLVAENTIEEKIIQLHNTKRDLAESLLEGSDQAARMSIHELIDLIKNT